MGLIAPLSLPALPLRRADLKAEKLLFLVGQDFGIGRGVCRAEQAPAFFQLILVQKGCVRIVDVTLDHLKGGGGRGGGGDEVGSGADGGGGEGGGDRRWR